MTLTHDRHLQTGIAGSVAVHALLLLLIVWGVSSQAGRRALREEAAQKEVIPEVTLIFPDQIIPEPPPTPAPEFFIKTGQNDAVAQAPKNAKFQSDRNTVAASLLPPTTTSALPMPKLDGRADVKPQLTNNDYQDGSLTPKPQAKPATPLPDMIARAEAEDSTPGQNRLPLEVRKAGETPAPAATKIQVRIPEDTPPEMTRPSDQDDFSAFERMSKSEGSISREGENSVDAVATPRGLYESKIKSAIEQKWQALVKASTNVGTGHVHFRFYVDKRGVPQDLTILSDARDADPAMRELTLRAILDSAIPPIPADLLTTLEDGRLKAEYKATLY